MLSPLPTGVTLQQIASLARSDRKYRLRKIISEYKVSEEIALDWLRAAQEAGLDVGLPRDDRDKKK